MDVQASNYLNLQALNDLRRKAGETPEQAIEPVARQFEAVFVHMMLKSMRDTVPEGGLLDNDSIKFYQDMMDNQLAVTLSEQGGIGLAKTIARQLAGAQGEAAAPNQGMSAQSEALRLSLGNPTLRSSFPDNGR